MELNNNSEGRVLFHSEVYSSENMERSISISLQLDEAYINISKDILTPLQAELFKEYLIKGGEDFED